MRKLLSILLISISVASCLEENLQPVEIKYNNMLDILNFAESHDDFINSPENPALIEVDEVNAELSSLLILDIRDPGDFVLGHIPGAINIAPQKVIDFLDTTKILNFEKVVVVSKSGQKAAYVTSLLRIIGYNNVYSLDYGMGYWNQIFADVWISSKSSSKYVDSYYLLRVPPKEPSYLSYSTPSVTFEDESKPFIKKLKDRVNQLITDYDKNSVITIEEFDNMLNTSTTRFGYGKNRFIICYDHTFNPNNINISENALLFYAHKVEPKPVFEDDSVTIKYYDTRYRILRPPEVHAFNGQAPEHDFSSDKLLFTIPHYKEIIIYSFNGQRSAYITAYLNLLGYNAKFVEFGAHSMLSKYSISWEIHGLVRYEDQLDTVYYPSPFTKYDFYPDSIRNYPYEVGNE